MIEKKTSRDKVLELLESNKGSYLSGELIASQIGISRTAVWKAIRKLQEDGYAIDAVTKRGYCLVRSSDVLSEKKIRSYLSPDSPGIEMEVFDIVDSTNTVCLKRASSMHNAAGSAAGVPGNGSSSSMINAGFHPYAAISGGQTQGRGRRGRSFFSPDGTGLYMSILLRPAEMTSDQAIRFTTIAAVAVAEAIEEVSGCNAGIKWVNDIYIQGRKVCGILTEASFNPEGGTLDYAVVGIGINVYEPIGGFPEDIKDRAGAVASGTISPDHSDKGSLSPSDHVIENGGRNRIAAEILNRFFSYFKDAELSSGLQRYVNEYKRRCFVIGMDVDVMKAGSKPESAHVLGLDDQCHLIVRYEDGSEEALSSGEISIRI